MSTRLTLASFVAVAATLTTAMIAGGHADASPKDQQREAVTPAEMTQYVAEPVLQSVPEESTDRDEAEQARRDDAPQSARSLAAMVASQPRPRELSRELNCLAGAIFFESRGESLAGQLAVGRVIVARSRSGRFPNSYCGVVFQRSQFSFVQGNSMPAIAKASNAWKNAVAIAQIAHSGSWRSPTEGALFFHAARINPAWRLTRIARVDNHVFYR